MSKEPADLGLEPYPRGDQWRRTACGLVESQDPRYTVEAIRYRAVNGGYPLVHMDRNVILYLYEQEAEHVTQLEVRVAELEAELAELKG